MCAAMLSVPGTTRGDETRALVVITSRDDGPYEGVLAGLRASLSASQGPHVRVRSMQSEGEAASDALLAARSVDRPLIAIGSNAARAALAAPGSAPVIACMVGDGDLRDAPNTTGVMLEFPLEIQLAWIRRFVPESRSIGVLYNPEENEARIAEARKAAERLGLRLVAREIHRPQDLPAALDSLAREADFLLAVTDQMVFSRQTTQAILLFSFRNRMPLSGLSASWVKAGALYALERDYADLGAQCAEMALEVLNGKKAKSIRPATPRKVVYAINVRTAEQLRIRLPDAIVENAAEIYR
jgi:putative tryptophan/tyrosine transport system substrate-binding protein